MNEKSASGETRRVNSADKETEFLSEFQRPSVENILCVSNDTTLKPVRDWEKFPMAIDTVRDRKLLRLSCAAGWSYFIRYWGCMDDKALQTDNFITNSTYSSNTVYPHLLPYDQFICTSSPFVVYLSPCSISWCYGNFNLATSWVTDIHSMVSVDYCLTCLQHVFFPLTTFGK